jgi:FixJ family two-component response regulator
MDRGKRVLVVEDDDSMRVATQRLLNAAGFATAAYASAEELLADGLCEDDACVVSVLVLPGRSGLDLLRGLRASGWLIPLILITAHDTPRARQEAADSGVTAYLAKPFLGSALVAAVRRATGASETG